MNTPPRNNHNVNQATPLRHILERTQNGEDEQNHLPPTRLFGFNDIDDIATEVSDNEDFGDLGDLGDNGNNGDNGDNERSFPAYPAYLPAQDSTPRRSEHWHWIPPRSAEPEQSTTNMRVDSTFSTNSQSDKTKYGRTKMLSKRKFIKKYTKLGHSRQRAIAKYEKAKMCFGKK